MSTIDKLDRLSNENTEVIQKVIELWKNEVLFSWRWWIGVSITILTWLFWMKFHKKDSRYRLLTAGFFVMTLSVALDGIGVQLGLWSYRFEVVPLIPAYLPYDLALMPVVIMSLIQFKPQYSPYKKAVIFAVFSALIGEPLIVVLDIYKPIDWRYFYSIPFYIIIYLIAYWLTTRKDYNELI